jgi:hypothetical protein
MPPDVIMGDTRAKSRNRDSPAALHPLAIRFTAELTLDITGPISAHGTLHPDEAAGFPRDPHRELTADRSGLAPLR